MTRDRTGREGGADAPTVFVRDLPPEPQPRDTALLLPAERRWMEQFERERDAAAFAAGRALLRRAVAPRLGCAAAEVPVDAPPWRRPRIAGSDLACSVAHGGDVVVVAVAPVGAVGVDVEPVDPPLPPDEAAWIAQHLLAARPAEVAALRAGAAPRRRFLARWTLTEAVLKALGTGLTADPRAVRLDLRGRPRLLAAPGVSPAAAKDWRLDLLEPAPGHLAAVAADRRSGPPRVERVA